MELSLQLLSNIFWHSGQLLPVVPKKIWTKVVDKDSSPAAMDWNELAIEGIGFDGSANSIFESGTTAP